MSGFIPPGRCGRGTAL